MKRLTLFVVVVLILLFGFSAHPSFASGSTVVFCAISTPARPAPASVAGCAQQPDCGSCCSSDLDFCEMYSTNLTQCYSYYDQCLNGCPGGGDGGDDCWELWGGYYVYVC